VTRKLNDGRLYRLVMFFQAAVELIGRRRELGFAARIAGTPRYFIHGDVRARY
jgi:hypothetical protein